MSEVQRAFASGEVSPTLYGRADVDRWRAALKKCENWIVEPEGGITVRQGFKHIDRVQRDAGNSDIRLIPFEFGPDDSVVIATYIKDTYRHWSYYSNGAIETADPSLGADLRFGPLVWPALITVAAGVATIIGGVSNRMPWAVGDKIILGIDGQAPTTSYGVLTISSNTGSTCVASTTTLPNGSYENAIVRPYQTWVAYPNRMTSIGNAVSMSNARFVQSGDTLYFTNGIEYPWRIVRENIYDATYNRNTQWRFPGDVTSTPPSVSGNATTLTGTAGTDTLRYRVTYTDRDGIESAVIRGAGASGTASLSSGRWNINAVAHGLVSNDVIWVTTAKSNDAGKRIFSVGDLVRVVVVDANNFTVPGDGAVSGTLAYQKIGGSSNALTTPTTSNPVTVAWSAVAGADFYNIYREFGRVYGYIGSTSALSFVDKGIIPDTKDTPGVGNGSPWRVINNTYGNIPTAVGIFQQRLMFGGFTLDPERIAASHTGNYINYELGAEDSSGLDFNLAGNKVSQVKHLVEIAGRSVALTSTAEWVLKGNSGTLTPTAINARADSYNGCSDVSPVVVGSNLIYLQRGDKIIRDAQYDFAQEALASRDLTLWAKHLFSYGIKRLAYQRTEQIVWALTKTGRLLGMTYIPEQNIWGWHQHYIDGQPIDDICVVSEAGIDRLYAISSESDTAYLNILQLPSRWDANTQTVDDHMGFDCWRVEDGTRTSGGSYVTATLTGGTNWTTSETLTLTASSSIFSAGTNTWLLKKGNDWVYVDQTGYTSGTVISVRPQTIVPSALRGAASERTLLCNNTVSSGLLHLANRTVGIIADGGRLPNQVVSGGGSITLDRKYGRIQVGLPITATAQTLDLEGDQQDTNLGDARHVTRVILWLLNTRGLKAGFDDNTLEEMVAVYDVVSQNAPALQSGAVDIPMQSTHSATGSVIIRQDSGLPAQIINARTVFNIGRDR